ncbi:Regulator of G-protein signaling 20 [Labeo rohita]|uniref:Regulator of G-protein signaling 20 n=1 Tax=Labeo rohita TaxID=84645 RepID=A0ABQ8MYG7_LABRO|nr:Regulator of G-protein signaling 20 [Labeo rohita]
MINLVALGLWEHWEIWPSTVVQSVRLSPCLMWGQLRHLLLACRHDERYLASGSYENEDENDNTEDRSKDPISFQSYWLRLSCILFPAAHGIRADGDAKEADVGAAGVGGGHHSTGAERAARPGEPWLQRLLLLLTVRNEDREERNRRASYDFKAEGNADFEESPKPTAEDVRLWGQSFDKLMHCPAGRSAFRQFLRTEFSEENMLFWLACEEFSKETNKSVIEEKARIIYEDYISILSPKEVSLDSRVREVINRNMLEPTSHTFDDAQLQIYTLMQRDSYPRFMNSPVYKNLLKTVSEQPVES